MADISVKQKEAKTVTFTITQSGAALPVTGGVFKFAVKKTKADTTYLIEKNTSDFDDSGAANGILRVVLDANDLDQDAGEYIGELKIALDGDSSSGSDGTNVDKSADLSIEILEAVITD